jgi:hypothetical protein
LIHLQLRLKVANLGVTGRSKLDPDWRRRHLRDIGAARVQRRERLGRSLHVGSHAEFTVVGRHHGKAGLIHIGYLLGGDAWTNCWAMQWTMAWMTRAARV